MSEGPWAQVCALPLPLVFSPTHPSVLSLIRALPIPVSPKTKKEN